MNARCFSTDAEVVGPTFCQATDPLAMDHHHHYPAAFFCSVLLSVRAQPNTPFSSARQDSTKCTFYSSKSQSGDVILKRTGTLSQVSPWSPAPNLPSTQKSRNIKSSLRQQMCFLSRERKLSPQHLTPASLILLVSSGIKHHV